jgi:putative alpha-1,2-mannosidase
MIIPRMYKPTTDGRGGNEDCGQMSAWYIFSSLGFYPVAPASGEYSIGSPLVRSATIRLENGKIFAIEAKNQSESNVYVQQVLLNGLPFTMPVLRHADVMKGGKLVFVMGAAPNKTLFAK